tara:strand:+ start:1132 stop:1308 length:177 start_codon:yes stop_codon:yes gene_type:complete
MPLGLNLVTLELGQRDGIQIVNLIQVMADLLPAYKAYIYVAIQSVLIGVMIVKRFKLN